MMINDDPEWLRLKAFILAKKEEALAQGMRDERVIAEWVFTHDELKDPLNLLLMLEHVAMPLADREFNARVLSEEELEERLRGVPDPLPGKLPTSKPRVIPIPPAGRKKQTLAGDDSPRDGVITTF